MRIMEQTVRATPSKVEHTYCNLLPDMEIAFFGRQQP
jgi:hypothetical protein